jgi:hypothetical protein
MFSILHTLLSWRQCTADTNLLTNAIAIDTSQLVVINYTFSLIFLKYKPYLKPLK